MPADLDSILRIELPLIVLIGERQMSVKEVMHLAPGAIIELTKDAEDDLDILVNNKTVGAGRAVKVGENFGVRVTRVGTLPSRIRALGLGNSVGANSGVNSGGSSGGTSGGGGARGSVGGSKRAKSARGVQVASHMQDEESDDAEV